MKNRFILIFLVLFVSMTSWGQQSQTDTKKEDKEFNEWLTKTLEKYEDILDLEDWQVFYMDSIYYHDYSQMRKEMAALGENKVSNVDLYYEVQDKWAEAVYQAMNKVLTPDQWARYLKSGIARDKKERDKRAKKK